MSDYLNAKTENVQKFLDKYLEKQKQELISEFLEFLYRIDEDYPVGDEIEKWEMKQKE